MPIQVLINIFIAFLWMFLQDEWSFLTFLGGYIVGIIVLIMLRRFFPTTLYLVGFLALIKLFVVFIHELITSSVLVIKQVLGPRTKISPGIITLETELETPLEVTLLALLLSLTPGSVVMEVSPDNKKFYIHAMDIPESSEAVFRAQHKFEKAIKEVTRIV